MPRRKVFDIDTAAYDLGTNEALLPQSLMNGRGRYKGSIGCVMKVPEVAADDTAQPAETVVLAVLIKIRAEVRGHRNAYPSRRADRGPAQRAFRRNVDNVRTRTVPAAFQTRNKWQSDSQVRVHRDRDAGRSPLARRVVVRFVSLPRPDQIDRMPARPKSAHESVCGQCHAVDFRRVGFGNVGEAHSFMR